MLGINICLGKWNKKFEGNKTEVLPTVQSLVGGSRCATSYIELVGVMWKR